MGCLTVRYFAGTDFCDAIKDMRRLMNLLDCSIESNMNGVTVVVMGNDSDIEESVIQIRSRIGSCDLDKFYIVK